MPTSSGCGMAVFLDGLKPCSHAFLYYLWRTFCPVLLSSVCYFLVEITCILNMVLQDAFSSTSLAACTIYGNQNHWCNNKGEGIVTASIVSKPQWIPKRYLLLNCYPCLQPSVVLVTGTLVPAGQQRSLLTSISYCFMPAQLSQVPLGLTQLQFGSPTFSVLGKAGKSSSEGVTSSVLCCLFHILSSLFRNTPLLFRQVSRPYF
jgi:hypothetical protein